MSRFVFSMHAAKRWFERCSNLCFEHEMSKLKKEKVRGRKDNESFYKTRSGALLVVRNSIVVTVLSRDMHKRMISRFFK